MPRKIQRKRIRQVHHEERLSEKRDASGISLQSAVTILGGITGIIVAIFWLGGRFYASGYFYAMNIPSFQISYSVWEYAEVSWLRLIAYFLARIYPPVLMIIFMVLAFLLVILVLKRLLPSLLIENAFRIILAQARAVWRTYRIILIILISVLFLYLLLLSFVDIRTSGIKDGQNAVLEKSHTVEIYSKEILPLGQGQIVPDTSPAITYYNGMKLLTFNNGKYYLFRDVDPVTCKPVQVYIIDSSPDIHFVLGDYSPITTPCAAKSTPSSNPASISTP